MKKTVSSILAFVLVVAILGMSASADGPVKRSESITYFDDGSYCISYITRFDHPETRAASSVVTGAKDVEYYNSSDELCFVFSVIGTFSYNGTTARATSADYDYEIFVSSWSLDSADSYCSGDTAYAEGTFERFLARDVVVEASLSCSPDGHLF